MNFVNTWKPLFSSFLIISRILNNNILRVRLSFVSLTFIRPSNLKSVVGYLNFERPLGVSNPEYKLHGDL